MENQKNKMTITKQDFHVLCLIDEGKNDIREIKEVINIDFDKIKKILEKLNKQVLIKLTRKEDFWFAYVTKKGNKRYISNKKYSKWIPKIFKILPLEI